MPKKMIAIFMSLLMLVMSMAVSATETEHVHEGCCCEEIETAAVVSGDEIMPLADLCSNCGTGTLEYTGTTTGTRQYITSCGHSTSITANDYYYETRYYYKYACSNNCGSGVSLVEYKAPTYKFYYCTLGYTSAP